ncbi:hypothetical protein PPL_03172 [Heterostelium album PN500]|uniref:Uncharacterized protein n=1 Tax=Heterostelium pallidum (strain ATCC 26659 / Pp 5 / PN500) TaxID=670386 RepID=D3B451_HETP5|nr:hypothetical protein PPL_03172 [Heterostelium album PN500]EFA84099.1 hypothetical protein PPL_03172 [Heterostelium album PN500]|eukprot:XP_020436216.1 hypothetical protein PPL_03172 [Heterostelium album PN500]
MSFTQRSLFHANHSKRWHINISNTLKNKMSVFKKKDKSDDKKKKSSDEGNVHL